MQMSLEKLGLIFLINYFNQLGTVKNHLLSAVKEVILAIQASLDIWAKTAPKAVLGSRLEFISPILSQIQSLLTYTIEKISPEIIQSESFVAGEEQRLKGHIVNSIISAIDDEIVHTRDTSSEKNKLKIEALHTVKKVLINQKTGAAANLEDQGGVRSARSSRVA